MARTLHTTTGALIALSMASPAQALEFAIGDVYGSVISFFTVGAAVRMEDRDPSLIAKLNLQPGLCTRTNWTTSNGFGSEALEYPGAQAGDIGRTCNATQNPDLNRLYVDAPGSFNINGDDGNMNFDKGDIVNAVAKLNTKMDLSWGNYNLFARGIWFFDDTYANFQPQNFDTTLQPRDESFPRASGKQFGTDFFLQDLYVSTFIPLGDRTLSLKVGRQGLNWGESTALPLNAINTVNPPDARLLRMPGFDLGELFQPVGMVVAGLDVTLNLSMEAFYQFEWRPAIIDAPGTFYSTSDVFGGSDEDGYYAMLSFGKAPEDPFGLYSSEDNGEDPFALGSAGSRTIYRIKDILPEDGGQYGIALRYFAENFNNGTEFAFYFANYHNRIPSASFYAADATCAGDAQNTLDLAISCGAGTGNIGTLALSEEPLPVDTVELAVEYAPNIKMFGVSFNTTVGEWAWSGEYSFRPNMPLQVHSIDLLYAAVQPAFPDNNVNLTDLDISGPIPDPGLLAALNDAIGRPLLGGLPDRPDTGRPLAENGAIVLPGRRVAVPDYVNTIYRDQPYDSSQPGGYYIRGYERFKLGQLTTTMLKTVGGDNWINASQIILIGEFGLTHVLDFPSLDEIQFQGQETNTHASSGADGTQNSIRDSAAFTNGFETAGNGDEECARRVYESDIYGPYEAEPCRQNPTAQDPEGFGDSVAYGIRLISLIRYQDFLFGWNFEPLVGLFYDIDGVSPGVGHNFYQGNTTGLLGLRFDYLSKWFTELRYTLQDGEKNDRRDRDTLAFTLRYEF